MKLNYKKLGNYIRSVNVRNIDNNIDLLLGVSNQKHFMPSIANIHGTDLSKYKVVKENQFAYGPVTSRNGDKISIALLSDEEEAIVSSSYQVFEIIDKNILNPEFLMLWFKRDEFDRYARFKSHGSVREIFDWEQMLDIRMPIPEINVQNNFVRLVKSINEIKNHYTKQVDTLKKILQTYTNIILENNIVVVDLLDKFNVMYGKSIISKEQKGLYTVYGAGGITGYDDKYDHKESQIIVGCRGTCGITTYTLPHSNITANSLIFNPIDKDYTKESYYSFLSLFNFEETITGSVQEQITIQSLEDRKFYIPKRISEKQEKILTLIVSLNLKLELIINQLKKLEDYVTRTIVNL